VRALVAKGASEEEVLDHFLGKYGERILAAPRVQGFNLLAYVMPVVALAMGGILILFLFRRAAGARPAEQPRVAPGGAPSTAFDESLQARFKEELERFER
jgi:cytochrome c-type biogenesis protein CcmH